MIEGRIVRDNVFGSIEEDAIRRDFTVNALYYNIADFSVRDYVGGYDDLARRELRLIGDPAQRYREDPVRMLRAVRLAAKLDFAIVPEARVPFEELGELLLWLASERSSFVTGAEFVADGGLTTGLARRRVLGAP